MAAATKTLATMALLTTLSWCVPAFAADAPIPAKGAGGILKSLEKSHDILSDQLGSLAERLDLFMGGKRVCEDSTDTNIQVGGSVILLKDGSVRFDQILRANISLPNTQDRFKVLFESNAENDRQPLSPGARTATEGQSLSQAGSNATSNFKAALQFATQEQHKWRFTADAGVDVQWPPDPFGRLRFRREFPFGDGWKLNFAQTVFWFTSLGPGERTQFDLEKRLANNMLFRSTTEALWKERDRGFDMGQNFSLYQELSGREVVVYKFGVTGQTKPDTHFRDWGVGIEYRKRLYKNWLYLSVQPAVAFSQANQYQSDPSIRVGFDISFGAKYVAPDEVESRP